MATLPQWMLRRLAPRALRVLERQEQREPALAAHRGRVGDSAQAFITAYDGVSTFVSTSGPSRSGQVESIDVLKRKLSGWTPLLVDDLAGFDRGEFAANDNVADDLFQRVDRLLKIVEAQGAEGDVVPYAEQMVADLRAALDAAKADAKNIGASSSEEADMRAAVRETAERFHRDLIAFRRTLRAHVGRSHPEYQKLRVVRVRTTDGDDDEIAEELLEEFGNTPASPGESDAVASEAAEESESSASGSGAANTPAA